MSTTSANVSFYSALWHLCWNRPLFWVVSLFGLGGTLWMFDEGSLQIVGTGIFALEIVVFWSPTAVFLGFVRKTARQVALLSRNGSFAGVSKRIVEKSFDRRSTELGFEAGGRFVKISSWDTLPGEEEEEMDYTVLYHRSDVEQFVVVEDLPVSLRTTLRGETRG